LNNEKELPTQSLPNLVNLASTIPTQVDCIGKKSVRGKELEELLRYRADRKRAKKSARASKKLNRR